MWTGTHSLVCREIPWWWGRIGTHSLFSGSSGARGGGGGDDYLVTPSNFGHGGGEGGGVGLWEWARAYFSHIRWNAQIFI